MSCAELAIGDAPIVRRLVIVAGTLAVHGVLGIALVALDAPREDDRRGSTLDIELVAPAPIPERPAPVKAPTSSGGQPAPRAHARTRAAHHAEPTHGELTTTIESTDDGGGASGHGRGGDGDGLGLGRGGLADLLPPAAPVPPPPPAPGPPPISRARPARLIYPSRQVQIDDALLFVATLVVDRDGLVAGAHLIHGFGGPRDDQAASLVWLFRYAPALDDAGLPIQSTVEQKFNVGR